MNIICGKEMLDVSKIDTVVIRSATTDELIKIEREKNGDYISAEAVMSSNLHEKLEKVIIKYGKNIGARLPEPILNESDLPVYDHDENPKRWSFQKSGAHDFSLFNFDNDGEAEVLWTFDIRYNSENGRTEKATRKCLLSQIIPILKELLELPKPKNAWKRFWADYSYEDIQNDIANVYKDYTSEKKKIDLRNETKRFFLDNYADKSILCITFHGETSTRNYLEECCGFDIFEKEKELQLCLLEYQKHQQKLNNSYDDGEKNVEYAIDWFIKSNKSIHIVPIKGDCESKYRYGCILLNKPDYIDDPQEYDHILVCSSGIIVIETKHWKGTVEIRDDGKWIRENEGETFGIESPKLQIYRHERMLEKIAPNIKIYSLLCFSNGKLIINGKDNFTEYPIITIDRLEEHLRKICSSNLYSDEEVDKIVDAINEHKVDIKN